MNIDVSYHGYTSCLRGAMSADELFLMYARAFLKPDQEDLIVLQGYFCFNPATFQSLTNNYCHFDMTRQPLESEQDERFHRRMASDGHPVGARRRRDPTIRTHRHWRRGVHCTIRTHHDHGRRRSPRWPLPIQDGADQRCNPFGLRHRARMGRCGT